MRILEKKFLTLFIVFVLGLQMVGLMLLNSAVVTLTNHHTDLGAPLYSVRQTVFNFMAPYYKLHGMLIVLVITCVAVSIGSLCFARRYGVQMKKRARQKPTEQLVASIDPLALVPENADVTQLLQIMRDGIARRELEIKRMAYWDLLTDLPNRAQFISLLIEEIENSQKEEHDRFFDNPSSCYVLMMDLDRFKLVNDIMGHSFGDVLLKRVAQRLRDAFPDMKLARLGGDEFALLMPNSNLDHARAAAQTMLLLLEQPITIEDQAVDLGAGIGIAGYPNNGDTAESILRHAEVAMYAAKRNLGNNFKVYSPEIDHASHQNLSLIGELRHAIQENQLRLYVQPKFGMHEQKIVGVEALIRWDHPTRGFLAPDQFIGFAEQTGVIRMLTRWMLNRAAAFCKDLRLRGIYLKIAVNVSTHDLLDPELPNKFAEILKRHDVEPSSICLEITESAIMADPIRAQTTLERLSAMGLELSIDDFGTGYSSLAYLKRLPVSEIKIDRSFISQMDHNDEDMTIVKSTIELGHNMGLRVVAEGVETANVMTMLSSMRCDQAQGNHINKPISSEKFAEWYAVQ